MEWSSILNAIIANPERHALFLNTLSMMENTGARKISACEDKNRVTLAILKHAAEEHRHAFYLKKLIAKITDENTCPSYERQYLMAPIESRFYLHVLDVRVSRYLKNKFQLTGAELRFAAYILVTFAIEVRAEALYPAYQQALDKAGVKITIKSIIVEEEEHLKEMRKQLRNRFGSEWEQEAARAIAIESELFEGWLQGLAA